VFLSLAALYSLAQLCAPAVAPQTLLAVARAESGFDPLAVAVNVVPRRVYHPASAAAAVALAGPLIARGESVDLGLGQINSRNLAALDLTLPAAFDPCRNLAGAAEILAGDFAASRPARIGAQPALRQALSRYNTGDPLRGLRNGYVSRVARSAALVAVQPPPSPTRPVVAPTGWDAFGDLHAASFVISPRSQGDTP
jgi:type IV secretion system protein VirB1